MNRFSSKGEKVRPIKISFRCSNTVSNILSNSHKLKLLKCNVYIKSDKTKGEINEYKRLGKKESEMLKEYPTPDEGQPRIILNKGILSLDGTEIDCYKSVQSLF